MSAVSLGIYEKALRDPEDWDRFFADVAAAGFAFTDLSIDESAQRASRLRWSQAQCGAVDDAARRAGVGIGALCLSLHRAIGPGSADPATRRRAVDVYRRGVDLAAALGCSLIQVAGYYAHYEPDHAKARHWYVEALDQALTHAAVAGVTLGVENVDGHDIDSISAALELVRELDSPYLALYPDIGNLAEHQLDVVAELRRGQGRMAAIHLKDVRVGEPRRVPLGAGITDFPAAFAELRRQDWRGRMLIEMWNDNAENSAALAADARVKAARMLKEAGIELI
jgi:L-ribulose-5-phosphate 3-epimerase/hexulose-6-phosphate isomerase